MEPLNQVGIVGLGTMGAGILEVFAKSGYAAVAVEQDAALVEKGRENLRKSTGRAVAKGKLTAEDSETLEARITWSDDLGALAGCDLVIEAIVERLDVKREVFQRLGGIVRPNAVLATNTSSLSVTEIAAATPHPERVVGMHFFNPAPVQKLVEVVTPKGADPGIVDNVVGLARNLGKHPVVCGDRAGFIANFLLFGYLGQALTLHFEQGVGKEALDAAVEKGFGVPMGPLALLDLIGLDTAVAILDAIHAETNAPRHRAPEPLRALVDEGRLGRKTGCGLFESYDKTADKTGATSETAPDTVVDALRKGHREDAQNMLDTGYATREDIDAAMALGCRMPSPFETGE